MNPYSFPSHLCFAFLLLVRMRQIKSKTHNIHNREGNKDSKDNEEDVADKEVVVKAKVEEANGSNMEAGAEAKEDKDKEGNGNSSNIEVGVEEVMEELVAVAVMHRAVEVVEDKEEAVVDINSNHVVIKAVVAVHVVEVVEIITIADTKVVVEVIVAAEEVVVVVVVDIAADVKTVVGMVVEEAEVEVEAEEVAMAVAVAEVEDVEEEEAEAEEVAEIAEQFCFLSLSPSVVFFLCPFCFPFILNSSGSLGGCSCQ